MVSSDDPFLMRFARKFAYWGRDCYCVGAENLLPEGTCERRFHTWLGGDSVVDHKYVFSEMGYNLKPLDLQGAIGLEQLKKLPHLHARRRTVKERLSRCFRTVPKELPGAETAWFGVPVICSTAEEKQHWVRHLESHRIQTRNYFAGNLLLHPGYRHLGEASHYPLANRVLKEVFFIGCHPSYGEDTLTYIEEVCQRGEAEWQRKQR
jgi:CDP-6-deoxy-D-xylo-4-hexulose-3-dehydrase